MVHHHRRTFYKVKMSLITISKLRLNLLEFSSVWLYFVRKENPMPMKLTFRNLFSSVGKEQLESDKAFRLNVRSISCFAAAAHSQCVFCWYCVGICLVLYWDDIIMLSKYFVTFKRKSQMKIQLLNHYFRFSYSASNDFNFFNSLFRRIYLHPTQHRALKTRGKLGSYCG